jgi:hypothetical protein
LIHELTVIAPFNSQLSILNLVNHFSTHLRPAKVNPMIIPLPWSFCSMSISSCLITMIIVSCVSPPWSSFYVHTPSLCDLVATTPYHIHLHHVLLMPNSKHLTHGISNLVSLITKTKLRLSPWPPLTSMLCIGCSSWASGRQAHWICCAFSSRPGPKNSLTGRAKAEG